MTVQEMDICLNVITGRPSADSERSVARGKDPPPKSVVRAKRFSVKSGKTKNLESPAVSSGRVVKGGRVKQQSLSRIVARSLNVGQPPGILKKSIPGAKVSAGKLKKSVQIIEANRLTSGQKPSEPRQNKKFEQKERKKAPGETVVSFTKQTKENVTTQSQLRAKKRSFSAADSSEKRSEAEARQEQKLDQKDIKDSDEPVISFTKVTKGNVAKPLLAKKRNVSETAPKKTLSEVFSKAEPKTTFDLVNTVGDEVPSKKAKLDDSVEPRKIKTKKKFEGQWERRKWEDGSRTDENFDEGSKRKTGGKISSLFSHNPEVPNIGQKLVKPINEPVFTGENFADLNVHPYTISNLAQNMEITKTTTVQRKAIPRIYSGADVLIRSQTGSGKTLAYALPIVELLHKIRPKLSRSSGLKALVVVPTRELALQTYECFLKLVKPFTWIVPGYLCGGEKRKAEKARLRKGCNILVGTPGRLLDHMKHTAALKLNEVRYFVLDEADRMFDMGYEKDISGIVSALKVAGTSDNSGYDPMGMLRRNAKKVFTDDEIQDLENDSQSKGKDDSAREEEESGEEEVEKRVEYHSSSEDETETGEPYVKFKRQGNKTNEPKSVAKSLPEPKRVEYEEGTNDANRSGVQTILLSATLTQSVEKLAGLAMKDPIFVDAAKENVEATDGDASDINEDLVVPQSVAQSYVVTPPKLRLVTLSAYIVGKCQSSGRHKILVFMATQDMVDYHTDILSSVLSRPTDENDEDSEPLVDVEFFRLHGSMTQKERTDVFKTFRLARSGVLLCTDVAARGLDMPKVDCVIQYTGPLSARDYVHRIGRTARAGSSGSSTIFLIPPEIEFVRMLESRRIRIRQEDMDDVLGRLIGPLSVRSTPRMAAIALQNQFENLVIEDKRLRDKACKAYVSWMRFYTSYPRDMREIFDRRQLHLGHFAKSFALRDPPQRIGGLGKSLREKEESKRLHDNRLTNERGDQATEKKPRQDQGAKGARRTTGSLKKVRMLNTSEFASGLQPLRKPKNH